MKTNFSLTIAWRSSKSDEKWKQSTIDQLFPEILEAIHLNFYLMKDDSELLDTQQSHYITRQHQNVAIAIKKGTQKKLAIFFHKHFVTSESSRSKKSSNPAEWNRDLRLSSDPSNNFLEKSVKF